jgi:hypothetical protein
MRWGLVLGALILTSSAARADQLTETPAIAPAPSISERLKSNVTLLSEELGQHLSAMSLDTFNLRFDAHTNRGNVGLDLGDTENLSFKIDSDVAFRGGAARVKARLDLGIAGRRLSFDLPEFDMVPRSFEGKSYVELRLPLIERNF